MSITITRPTKNVDIITDMTLMSQIVDAANSLHDLQQEATTGLTETELSARNAEIQEAQENLKKFIAQQDEKTITLALRALNASHWIMVVTKNTHTVEGKIVKDFPAMIAQALPLMLETATWKATGETEDMGGPEEIKQFVDSLLDTQIMDLAETLQELNSPVTTLPKEILNLI